MSGGGPLFVDVVIPFRRWDAWTAECLQATLALEPLASGLRWFPMSRCRPRFGRIFARCLTRKTFARW